MNTATTRKASIDDLLPLAMLFDTYRQFYQQTPDLALAKAFIVARLNNQDSVIFVAETSDEKLVGFCQIYPSFCSVIAAKIGVFVPPIGIGDPVSRWGSCASSGQIRYSWRLILAPSFVRRATVAHEVAHRIHMNHGAAFHALVKKTLGEDPVPARKWLRSNGSALHWFGRSS